jgi:hypothetical protein
MLLAREVVSYISRQLVKSLTPATIETSNPDLVAEKIAEVISDELAVEDRLNDEVREILSQYADYMRREGVSYQEMFRRIKNTLITQRKVIRASGRDSGDPMKLSRDKVNDISHKLIEMPRKSRELRLRNKDSNAVRLEIVRQMTDVLMTEEKWIARRHQQDPAPKTRDSRRRGGHSAPPLLRRRTQEAGYRYPHAVIQNPFQFAAAGSIMART